MERDRNEEQRRAALGNIGLAIKLLADAAAMWPSPAFEDVIFQSIASLCNHAAAHVIGTQDQPFMRGQ